MWHQSHSSVTPSCFFLSNISYEHSEHTFPGGEMKHAFIAVILICCLALSATAQVTFAPHMVQNSTLIRHANAADLNADGFCEVVSSDWTTHDVLIWSRTAPDTWASTTLDPSFTSAQMTEILDLDQDGDLDIVGAASGASSGLRWWRNDGGGTYTTQQIDSQFPCIYIDMADIDGDGDADLVAVRYDYTELVWYENDMPNGWTQHMVENTRNTEHAHLSDLDGDGDIDIAAFHQPETLAWHEQDADNSWIYHELSPTMLTTALLIDDLDNDGDNDIVSHINYISDMYVWEQTSPGQFQSHLIFGGAGYIDDYDSADIDGDTYPDIVLSLNAANRISYLSFNSIDDYTEHVVVENYTQAHGIQIADMDGDTDPDILSWVPNRLSIDWFEHDGYSSVDETNNGATQPVEFSLQPAYPNPFNATTTVVLDLPRPASVSVEVLNTLGQQVSVLHQGQAAAGQLTLPWNAKSSASGVYYLRASMLNGPTVTQKICYVR